MSSPHQKYTAFLIDRDAGQDNEVALAEGLDVGVVSGVQAFPLILGNASVGNRLLIFTGTAIFDAPGHHGNLERGIVRIRLRHSLPKAVSFISSATVAALASIHSEDEEDAVFAADGAETVLGPTAGGVLPPGSNLPDDELYVIIDAAILGEDSRLQRIAYQANVLVLDTQPDLESLLVARFDLNFSPAITILPNEGWNFKLTLTGPAPGNVGDVVSFTLTSSNTQVIDI